MNRLLRYRKLLELWVCACNSNLLDSWIGGINLFLVCSVSLVAGILYDRGYWCVPCVLFETPY